jgi:FlaA1/EpsC-like NDP-sugar epimerase
MIAFKLIAAPQFSARLVAMSRYQKIGLMIAADLIFLPICFMFAVLLRVGDPDIALANGIRVPILIGLLTIAVFAVTGLYGAIIRFIELPLLMTAGIGLAVVVSVTYLLLRIFEYTDVPSNAFLIYSFTAFTYMATSRLSARAILRNSYAPWGREKEHTVAIYGAGEAGVKLCHAMRSSEKYEAVCFFDDKLALDNRNVAGLKVVHSSRLVDAVREKHIGLIVIAIPSAMPAQRREIMNCACKANTPVKILCSLMELADEEISTRSIREIKIEDLLGRDPIRPDANLFGKCIDHQNILVTGAGGSIGSELCRQIMTLSPSRVHLLDHSEYALYKIEQELTRNFPAMPVSSHLGSVCDAGLVERVLRENNIDTVYHAAAYKHVPLVEANMAEGVRNNILGARVVADAAAKIGVRYCVLVSSDKAVRPTSVMGASKRIAELIFQAAALSAQSNTKFCMVRFGNVLGSSGSVVPLFKSQIERGGPITVTHPDVVRYFMSIPEAAQLVMQAGAMATGGDVFFMDMGEPVKIVSLARTMIAMCGLRENSETNPQGDIEIRFTGLRPGEKLYEELVCDAPAIPSEHPRILRTTEYEIAPEVLHEQIERLMGACASGDRAMIQFLVKKLVRGYTPSVPMDEAPAKMSVLKDAEPLPLTHGVLSNLKTT